MALPQMMMAQNTYENYTFLTLAGPEAQEGQGSMDGVDDNAAGLNAPVGVVRDSGGNLYIADSANHTIRKVAPDGSVSTVAGMAGVSGSADGLGGAARFNSRFRHCPGWKRKYLCIRPRQQHYQKNFAFRHGDHSGGPGINAWNREWHRQRCEVSFFPTVLPWIAATIVYVADTSSDTIRKITPAGVVTTLAGSANHAGSADKTGTSATFNSPTALSRLTGPEIST